MKRLLLFLFFASALYLAGCAGNESGDSKDNNIEDQVILRPFSDSLLVDTFKVTLKGAKVKDMVMQFTITAHNGKVIYSKDFRAAEMIENYKSTLDLDREKKQKEFFLKEFNLFFEDENFLEPAVTENEEPDQYTPDKEFHKSLKLASLNGFKYRLSNSKKVYIAWSEKDKKVKVYYECC